MFDPTPVTQDSTTTSGFDSSGGRELQGATSSARSESEGPTKDPKQCFTSVPPPRRVATGRATTTTGPASDGTATTNDTAGRRATAAGRAVVVAAVDGRRPSARPSQYRGARSHLHRVKDASNEQDDDDNDVDEPEGQELSNDAGGSDDLADEAAGVVVSLCPSMDLMVLGSGGASGGGGGGGGGASSQESRQQQQLSWALHRTMSPNKLSSMNAENLSTSGRRNSDDNDEGSHSATATTVATAGCWREDGRLYAILSHSAGASSLSSSSSSSLLSVHVYAVEDMMRDWNSATGLPALPVPNYSNKSTQMRSQSVSVAVLASAWSGVGAAHPSWTLTDEALERRWNNENLNFRTHYPPSKYHTSYVMETATMKPKDQGLASTLGGSFTNSGNILGDDPHLYQHHHEPHGDDGTSRTVLPCANPYSLLAVVTRATTGVASTSRSPPSTTYQLTTYLHGRYPYVVSLPLLPLDDASRRQAGVPIGTTARMALSHTLSHVVTALPAASSSVVVACRLPRTVTRDAAVAARVIALDHHLNQLALAVPDIASSYASSLHPLNQKLDALVGTLQRYGHSDGDGITNPFLAECLTSHITGMSTVDSQLHAAFEQYFSSAQFNDQLFTRMEQSVMVALSSIESTLQQRVVAPCQAAVVQAGDLLGLELASLDEDDDDNYRQRIRDARAVVEAAKRLFLAVEQVLRHAIETRFVVRDWMDWLRSAAATVKARGTPPTSALYQNAVQRRATDELTLRVLQRLSGTSSSQAAKIDGRTKSSRTDAILGLQLGVLLDKLPEATNHVAVALKEWQKGPCDVARSRTKLRALTLVGQRVLALTTRIGSGTAAAKSMPPHPSSAGDDGCFLPHPTAEPSREWIVTASQVVGSTVESNSINLFALLLNPRRSDEDDDEESDEEVEEKVFEAGDSQRCDGWTARLELASNEDAGPCRVVDAVFYGDNGKCSLSSMDGGTGTERRQSLALLVERTSNQALELWLVKYDACQFSPVSLAAGESSWSEIAVEGSPAVTHTVMPLAKGCELDDDDGAASSSPTPILYARMRTIGSTADKLPSSVRLEVSGSRGMGAVVTNHPTLGTAVIDLYDLEEDEDDDDGEEGSDDDEMQTD